MKDSLKNLKIYILVFVIICSFCLNIDFTQIHAKTAVLEKPITKSKSIVNYIQVSPLSVVENPDKYLNKNITFEAEYVSFSSLGLDYPPAKRDSSKYISVLIKRDDVNTNVIPLSEMKIFITRELAEKNVDIETGDKVKIEGKVFSTALGDPWVDVDTFKIISIKKSDDKNKK